MLLCLVRLLWVCLLIVSVAFEICLDKSATPAPYEHS